jgi:hypothetical protein
MELFFINQGELCMLTKSQRNLVEKIENENRIKEKKLFNDLCEAARQLDEISIFRMFPLNKVKIDFHPDPFHMTFDSETAAMKMAMEGNHAATEMLLSRFDANPGKVIEGYARSKNIAKVNELLAREGFAKYADYAMQGYAYAGNSDEVNKLLELKDTHLNFPAYGYARAGNLVELKKLFDREDCKPNVIAMALEGSAHSELYAQVETIIILGSQLLDAKDAQKNQTQMKNLRDLFMKKPDHFADLCGWAVSGYANIGYFSNPDLTVKLLASQVNGRIFKHIRDFVAKHALYMSNISMDTIIDNATLLRKKMLDDKISFEEALAAGLPEKQAAAESRQNRFKFINPLTQKKSRAEKKDESNHNIAPAAVTEADTTVHSEQKAAVSEAARDACETTAATHAGIENYNNPIVDNTEDGSSSPYNNMKI